MIHDKYEAVIGLEIHAQLLTESKLFCSDKVAYGSLPNVHAGPITLAHPGTLPKLNKKAVELAVRMGLACGCRIANDNFFARKNYFYPDLPKGYQTSQHTHPICIGGIVPIFPKEGPRQVLLNRIHLEEDAGKSIHDWDPLATCIDLNRAGTPLIEIVTEPSIHHSEDAFLYVTEIRKLVQWLGVCDGNMEEGSLRCDANVSIRRKGDLKLGTKVEVKNLNSIRNVKRAIDHELRRMVDLVESGGKVVQQTRGYDADNDVTHPLRDKEEANDYRYFPCPDLPPLRLSESYIGSVRQTMPTLPNDRAEHYRNAFGLTPYDAAQLCESKPFSDYFDSVARVCDNHKAIANWMLGPVRQYMNEKSVPIERLPLSPTSLSELIDLVSKGAVSFSSAASRILPVVVEESISPLSAAQRLDLLQTAADDQLEAWAKQVLDNMPAKVDEYKKGKKGVIGLFVGEVKKLSKGKADPKKTTDVFQRLLGQ